MRTLLIALTVSLWSCNSHPDFENYLADIGINLSDEFKVIEDKTHSAIGDVAIEFTLQISERDYGTIVDKIRQTENYQEYTDDLGNDLGNVSQYDYIIKAYKSGDDFVLQKDWIAEPIMVQIILQPDRRLHFRYAED